MSLYYISESDIVSSNSVTEGTDFWLPDGLSGNYSTAVDTRSLSISLLPTANTSSNLDLSKNSTTNVALLFYENPNGKVSALLYRLMNIVNENPQAGMSQQDQWIDITSQESKALPNEFRNPPGFHYSNTFYKDSGYKDIKPSRTLYETDPFAVYSTPFFSAPNLFKSVSAIFYSPFNLPLNTTSPLAGDCFFTASYGASINGTGNFSLDGMHYATPCAE